jgi:NADH dehydrogenase FAD-containing subunit
VPITFLTAEAEIGDLGIGQTAASRDLARLLAERDIPTRANITIARVDRHQVTLTTGETFPARLAIVMPPFTGAADIWKSAKLTDTAGFVPITSEYRHVEHDTIYAAGVASCFDHAVPPLPERRPIQSGYLSLHMGERAGQNAAASLGYGRPAGQTLPFVVDLRVVDGGNAGLLLASRGRDSLRHSSVRLPGKSAHGLKLAIEHRILHELQSGRHGHKLGLRVRGHALAGEELPSDTAELLAASRSR